MTEGDIGGLVVTEERVTSYWASSSKGGTRGYNKAFLLSDWPEVWLLRSHPRPTTLSTWGRSLISPAMCAHVRSSAQVLTQVTIHRLAFECGKTLTH